MNVKYIITRRRAIFNVIKDALLGAALVGGATLALNILYWLYAPYNIASVQEPISIENVNDELVAGDILIMTVIAEKYIDVKADVNRLIVCDNGASYNVESVQPPGTNLPQGSFINTRYFRTDDSIPAGAVCIFRFDNFYKPNPIRVVHLTWESEPFTFIAGE